MFWNVNTISKRLFLSFGILAVNIILISFLSYQFINLNKSVYQYSKRIEKQRVDILHMMKLDLDFLRFETINQQFYLTGQSKLISRRDSLYRLIRKENSILHRDMEKSSIDITNQFDAINTTLKNYDLTFQLIKNKILIRGFKDAGLEGMMRKYAHELEKHSVEFSLADVLMLRRHEKDYILRKEEQYIEKLNTLANRLAAQCKSSNSPNQFLIYLLTSYQQTFNELTVVDEEIGLLPMQGLLGKLNSFTNDLSSQLEILVTATDEFATTTIQKRLVTYILIGIGSIIISFSITYVTVRRLTRPIKKLSSSIGKFMVNQGFNEEELSDSAVTNEINNLSASFIKLTRKLKAQFDEIQRKSILLENRNKELQKLNEDLDRFIYSSAHDLKSPLASLNGLIYLANREINLPEHSHYFDKMKSSIIKMEGFILDITDYAKNKRQIIKSERVRLDTMIDDIFQTLQFIPLSDDITKTVSADDGEFYTDKARLEIILKNLISNAVRYADHDKSRPYINIKVETSRQQAVIKIEDNGIGIDDKHIYRIFEMFYRATDNAKGSGLGLFLVRESVKMLRGTIAVQSELGKGTSFILSLPNLKQINVNHLPESEPIKFLTAS